MQSFYNRKYLNLADKPGQNGLNSYADDAALSLSKHNTNESLKWTSKLEDVIYQCAAVKTALAMPSPPTPILLENDIDQFVGELKKNVSQGTKHQLSSDFANKRKLNDGYETSCLSSAKDSGHRNLFLNTQVTRRENREGYRTPSHTETTRNEDRMLDNARACSSRQSDNQAVPFRTARQQLVINDQMNQKSGSNNYGQDNKMLNPSLYGTNKKSLGARRGGVMNAFTPPVIKSNQEEQNGNSNATNEDEILQDERLKGIDAKLVELIQNEIMDSGKPISWEEIAGLEFAKNTIQEIVIWPMLRPDIFTGLRGPPKGLLLFGPPGTGKTLIGKCIASQSKSTFFSISASSITSKWIGEGEKMVRALFAVARCRQPAVVFIDEIDSLLTQRTESEHEATRRIKTEFLVQLDGCCTNSEDRLLVVGATNRPQELDEAARRRLVKRLYIPLPNGPARTQIIHNLMAELKHSLTGTEIENVCRSTEGYSGADMTNLCKEAALGPIRSLSFREMETVRPEDVRPISYQDFVAALGQVKASVGTSDLKLYEDWNRQYGSGL